jgi:hypothetical protein
MAENVRRGKFLERLDEITQPRTVDVTVKTSVDRDVITDNLEERLARELMTDR